MQSKWRMGLIALVALLVVQPAAWADFDQAMTYFKSSKWTEAASEFQALVDETPDYADGHFMLAICLSKTGKLEDAEKSFLKAIELNGEKFEYHYNLANTYMQARKYDKAIGTLNNAEGLAANEQYKQAIYKLRGFAEAQKKDWEAAVADLERVRPDAAVLTQLGKAYFSLGDNEKAADALGQAAKSAPQDAEIRELRAEALLNVAAKASSEAAKAKNYTLAMNEGEALLKLQPGTFKGYYILGRAALGAKEYPRAVEAFQSALKKDPDHCNAMVNLGKSLMATKDWSNAATSFDNATKCDSKMSMAWENLAYTLQKQDKLDEAITNYEKALTLKPSSSFAKENMEICRQNLEIKAANAKMDAEERRLLEEQRKAEEEFRKAKEKEEEWKKRQEED